MKKIEIIVQSFQNTLNDFVNAVKNIEEHKNIKTKNKIIFNSIDELNSLLTPKKIKLLEILKKENIESITELSKKLNRNYKNVYEDVMFLKEIGLIKLQKKGRTLKPTVLFDEIDIKIPLVKEKVAWKIYRK